MSPRVRFGVAACVVVLAIVGLIGFSLSGATAYYRTPAELRAGSYRSSPRQRIRVAGVVVWDSVVRKGAETSFEIADGKASVPVTTDAVLPDTFGAGVRSPENSTGCSLSVTITGSAPSSGSIHTSRKCVGSG